MARKTEVKSLTNTLAGRSKIHGEFTINSEIAQKLKDTLRSAPGWDELSVDKKEALDMIMHKSARIVVGNANEPDHWHDIGGYAKLAEDRCITE